MSNDGHVKCRLCGLRKRKHRPIFEDDSSDVKRKESQTLPAIIHKCLHFKIEKEDDLPKLICDDCYTKIIDWHVFAQRCVKAQARFQRIKFKIPVNHLITEARNVKKEKRKKSSSKAKKKGSSKVSVDLKSVYCSENQVYVVDSNLDSLQEIDGSLKENFIIPHNIHQSNDLHFPGTENVNENVEDSLAKDENIENFNIDWLAILQNNREGIQENEGLELELNYQELLPPDQEVLVQNSPVYEGNTLDQSYREIVQGEPESLQNDQNIASTYRELCLDIEQYRETNHIEEENNRRVLSTYQTIDPECLQTECISLQPTYQDLCLELKQQYHQNNAKCEKSKNSEVILSRCLEQSSHDTGDLNDCTQVVNEEEIVKSISSVELRRLKKIHNCQYCERTYATKRTLREHLSIHENPEELHCAHCSKVFYSKRPLKCHLDLHSENPNYCCHVCGRLCHTSSALRNHIRLHKEDDHRHVCDVCTKDFRLRHQLDRHMLTHIEARSHQCPECPLAFNQRNHLTQHYNSIHSQKQKYACSICNKEYRYINHYKAHLLRHAGTRDNKCATCDKSFVTRNDLMRHERTHSREKPFKCPSCPKSFADCSNRKRHINQTHSSGNQQKPKTKRKKQMTVVKTYENLESFLQSSEVMETLNNDEFMNVEYVDCTLAEDGVIYGSLDEKTSNEYAILCNVEDDMTQTGNDVGPFVSTSGTEIFLAANDGAEERNTLLKSGSMNTNTMFLEGDVMEEGTSSIYSIGSESLIDNSLITE